MDSAGAFGAGLLLTMLFVLITVVMIDKSKEVDCRNSCSPMRCYTYVDSTYRLCYTQDGGVELK